MIPKPLSGPLAEDLVDRIGVAFVGAGLVVPDWPGVH